MTADSKKSTGRKPFVLPIAIVQAGQPKAAGDTVQLTSAQIDRIKQAAGAHQPKTPTPEEEK